MNILAQLAAPFPPDRVSWRVGPTTADKSKGQALCYIDARDVMARLDEIFGEQWQCENVPMHNSTTCCRIGLPVGPNGEVRWRSDGAGATGNVDDEKQREMAEKGGYSDAFKRAAVQWGIGRYLYDIDTPWVEIEPAGKSYRIKRSEYAKLRALLPGTPIEQPKKDSRAAYTALSNILMETTTVAEVDAFGPSNKAAIDSLPADWRRKLKAEKDERRAMFAAREQLKEAAE